MSVRADRDALLLQFHAAGLQPVIATNGSIPHADIQVAKVPADQTQGVDEARELLDVWVTERGKARLAHAHGAFMSSEVSVDMQADAIAFRQRLADAIDPSTERTGDQVI